MIREMIRIIIFKNDCDPQFESCKKIHDPWSVNRIKIFVICRTLISLTRTINLAWSTGAVHLRDTYYVRIFTVHTHLVRCLGTCRKVAVHFLYRARQKRKSNGYINMDLYFEVKILPFPVCIHSSWCSNRRFSSHYRRLYRAFRFHLQKLGDW